MQETENQVSLSETRSSASAVASQITRRITAEPKAQRVSSATKQVICSLNILMESPPLSRRQTTCLSCRRL